MTAGVIILYLATAIGLVLVTSIRPVAYRILVLLLLATAVNETWITVLKNTGNRLLLYNLFSLVEMLAWSIIFIFTNSTRKYLQVTVAVILLASSIYEIYNRNAFHSITYRAFSIYAIINCIYYFWNVSNINKQFSIRRDGVFWILSGLFIFQVVFLFYLTATAFPEFRKAKDALMVFRTIISTINIVYYLMLAYGLICLSTYRQ